MTPLAGRRIVDLSRYAPGPYCSLLCASLGAEVIKVEAPETGDPLRQLDPAGFERLNRGKKSVVLDLKTDAGVGRFRKLLATADVLLESFRPGVMARLGLDDPSVREIAPHIVYVALSGYGQTGPYAERAGHDVNYMAVSGALDGVGRPLPMQFADFAAGGLFALVAILASLMEGNGRYIDLAMHEGLLSFSALSEGPAGGALSGRYANYTVYPTKDGGALSVGALEPKFWAAFCDVIGRPDLVSENRDPDTRAAVAEIIATRSRDEWEVLFRGADGCAEIVRSPGEALGHPQARHRGQTPGELTLPFGLDANVLRRAPILGEHDDEILRPLG